jgi:hypothetical protein
MTEPCSASLSWRSGDPYFNVWNSYFTTAALCFMARPSLKSIALDRHSIDDGGTRRSPNACNKGHAVA